MITKIQIQQRTTPEFIIDSIPPNHYFVFGSNEAGRHGKGAAKSAMKFGAKYGQAFGFQGSTFAIPTVNSTVSNKLRIEKIKYWVNKFIDEVKKNPDKTFLVTPIGCGLAGWTVKDIAPLFKVCIDLPNVHLPAVFWKKLVNFEDKNG